MANKHSGFKLTGNVDADGKKIENLPEPSADHEPARKGELDDKIEEGSLVHLANAIYGHRVLLNTQTNNLLFSAEKRFKVTKTGADLFYSSEKLFDGDSNLAALKIADGVTNTIHIDLMDKGEFDESGLTYAYGWIFIHFYAGEDTMQVRTRLKTKSGDPDHVWRPWRDAEIVSQVGTKFVLGVRQSGEYYCNEMEIEITADGGECWVTEIDYHLDRVFVAENMPAVYRNVITKLYKDLELRNDENEIMTKLNRLEAAIQMKETTTPSAASGYGKIYTKDDNKLYFQDGAGVEHEISLV